MLDINNDKIKSLIFKGCFGLEKESLRVSRDGHIVHTPHQFVSNPRISRDFCENQTEINTDVCTSIDEVYEELTEYTDAIWKRISEDDELLWPFSNPPYIIDEADIPIARFYGEDSHKTAYREYLADKYGRFKMTFSGIHFNYSFDEELLHVGYEDYIGENNLAAPVTFSEYKDTFYLELGKKMSAYGWLLVCLTAASPILDISFVERGRCGESLFTGMASVRCSENGYWNFFSPIFDYSSIDKYADSIQRYVDGGMLASPHELYYPVRLKPAGVNTLESLRENGIDHIELRMIDLNPYCYGGIDKRDIKFAHMMLVWLATQPDIEFSDLNQIYAVQNFRNAARYNLRNYKIVFGDKSSHCIPEAGLLMLSEMEKIYSQFGKEYSDIIEFQRSKLTNPENRYAYRVKQEYKNDFVSKGLKLAEDYNIMSTERANKQMNKDNILERH